MIFADLNSVANNATVVFGVVATLTAVVLGFLSAKNKITITSLEESSNALRYLNSDKDLQIKSYKDQNSLLSQKAKVLEDQVTQAPSINELAVQLTTQHKEMMQTMSNMTKELGNVAKAMAKD